MGWQSSGDSMQGTHIFFNSKEDAILFAEKQGMMVPALDLEPRADFDRLSVVHPGAEAQTFRGEILRRKLPPLAGKAEDHPHQVNCSCGVGSLFEGMRRVYISSVPMLVFYLVMGYACFQRFHPSTLLTQPYPHRNGILMTRNTSRQSTAAQKPPASSQPQS
jgi:hypothetical protein